MTTLLGRAVQVLHEQDHLSRSDLGDRLSVTRSTVSTVVTELVRQGYVNETGGVRGHVGRPSHHVQVVPESLTCISVDVQRDRLSVMRYGLGGHVLATENLSRRTSALTADAIASEIADAVAVLAGSSSSLRAVSVSVPGVVHEGTVHHAPELEWRDLPLAEPTASAIFQRTGIRPQIVWSNDANVGALGESLRGVAQGVPSVLYLASGIGIGAGLIRRGEVIDGAHGFAGEVGHMVVSPEGPLCACGARGCWQTLVGIDALRTAAQYPSASAIDLLHASRAGDPAVRAALAETSGWFAVGLVNLALTLDPHTVVVGGHLGTLLTEIGPEFHRRWAGSIVGQRPAPRLVASTLPHAALVGAGERGIHVALGLM